jgi:hypothetical protein
MNSEKGKLRHQNREVKAIFGTRDLLFSFNGTIKEKAPPFNMSTALISYNNAADLMGRQFFIGVVGPDEVVISVNNGVTISGTLCQPVNSVTQISGKLSWLQVLSLGI